MRFPAKQYTTRCVTRLKQAGARIDRRARWTLVPLVVAIVIFVTPIWSAAVRFTSFDDAHPDSLRVPVLVYHTIAPIHPGQSAEQRQLTVDTATFRQQMSYLAANRYNVIRMSTLIDALQGNGTVPPQSVVITFDDGWLTQYDNALPILQQMHFTATFFVITKQIGRGSKYMGLDQVKALQRAGMTIASHSRTHPNLTKASDARLRDEIEGSRQDLQQMLGVSADVFAYPYGAWNRHVAAVAEKAGYRAARAYPGGAWNDATERYAMRSVLATDDMSAFVREVGVPLVATRASPGQVAAVGRR
jgi:peptidoglycan/xylan/chitin deacetylase (PgdA/CDA1 family)